MSRHKVKEDLNMFRNLFKNMFKDFVNKFNFKQKTEIRKFQNSKDIISILLQNNGASRIGAELLGKEIIYGLPVTIYKLRRSSNGSDYFFIAYIQRNNEQYQVVIDEDWLPFRENINEAIRSSEKVIINLFIHEGKGGIKYGENKSKRSGRKKL